jgi:hypothetical protein
MPATAVGQGEGQVHRRVERSAAGEGVAHQHPGDEGAQNRVHRRGDEGEPEGELEGRGDPRLRGDRPQSSKPEARRLEGERGKRDQDDEAEVGERVAEGEGKARQDAGPPPGEGEGGHRDVP